MAPSVLLLLTPSGCATEAAVKKSPATATVASSGVPTHHQITDSYALTAIDRAIYGSVPDDESTSLRGFWGRLSGSGNGGEDWNKFGPSAYTPGQLAKILNMSYTRQDYHTIQKDVVHYVLSQLEGTFSSDLVTAAKSVDQPMESAADIMAKG